MIRINHTRHLILLLITFLYSQNAFPITKIFFIEANMPTTPWTLGLLKHQALGFQNDESFIECHFTQKGILIVNKGEYGRKNLRRELFATGKKPLQDYVDWCSKWADDHEYTLGVFDCWTLVEDFCHDHHITNKRVDHANWVRDILMIRGTANFLERSKKSWKEKHKIKSFLYAATIPIYAIGYGLYSTFKVGFRDIRRLYRKAHSKKNVHAKPCKQHKKNLES